MDTETCQHQQIVLVYAAGEKSPAGGQKKDLLVRCAKCEKELFRMPVSGKKVVNLLPL